MISIFKNGKKFNKINGINLLFRANRESRNHKKGARTKSCAFFVFVFSSSLFGLRGKNYLE